MRSLAFLVLAIASLTIGASAVASSVEATNAVVRATVAGQGMGIAFVDLRAQQPVTLVGAESPVCQSIVLHEMKKEGITLSMSRIDSIKLTPGSTARLRAGAEHLMLMRVKYELVAGTTVPLRLIFVDEAGQTFTGDVVAKVEGKQQREDDH